MVVVDHVETKVLLDNKPYKKQKLVAGDARNHLKWGNIKLMDRPVGGNTLQ